MKTNFFKKSNESKKSELVEMNKEELKNIQGGLEMVYIRDKDGRITIAIIP